MSNSFFPYNVVSFSTSPEGKPIALALPLGLLKVDNGGLESEGYDIGANELSEAL